MNGLEILVYGLFDYAGMFPPAKLSLEETLKKAAALAKDLKNPAMVKADMVLTFADLVQIDDKSLEGAGFSEERTMHICILGEPFGSDKDAYAGAIKAVSVFNKEGVDKKIRRKVVSFEVKLPEGEKVPAAAVALDRLRRGLALGDVQIFVEPEWKAEDWKNRTGELFTMLDALNSDAGRAKVGLKVRGSGPMAVDAGALTHIIPLVVKRALPFKVTAGLHHPMYESGRSDGALGFVSLVVALRLAGGLIPSEFGPDKIKECLECTEVGSFDFDDKIAWKKSAIGTQEIYNQKQRVPFSIGACSLEEPDGELVRLFSPSEVSASK